MVGHILYARYRTKAGRLGVACISNEGPVLPQAGVGQGGFRSSGFGICWVLEPAGAPNLVDVLDFSRLGCARLGCASHDNVCLDCARLDNSRHDNARHNARPDRARPDRVCLDSARLDRALLDGARLDSACPDSARLGGARLDSAHPDSAHSKNARLDSARPDSARPDSVRLDSACLDRARLDRAHLDRARLDRARLDRALLDSARLGRVRLGSACRDYFHQGCSGDCPERRPSVHNLSRNIKNLKPERVSQSRYGEGRAVLPMRREFGYWRALSPSARNLAESAFKDLICACKTTSSATYLYHAACREQASFHFIPL